MNTTKYVITIDTKSFVNARKVIHVATHERLTHYAPSLDNAMDFAEGKLQELYSSYSTTKQTKFSTNIWANDIIEIVRYGPGMQIYFCNAGHETRIHIGTITISEEPRQELTGATEQKESFEKQIIEEIAEINKQIAENDKRIAENDKQIAEKDRQIAKLTKSIEEGDERYNKLRKTMLDHLYTHIPASLGPVWTALHD